MRLYAYFWGAATGISLLIAFGDYRKVFFLLLALVFWSIAIRYIEEATNE